MPGSVTRFAPLPSLTPPPALLPDFASGSGLWPMLSCLQVAADVVRSTPSQSTINLFVRTCLHAFLSTRFSACLQRASVYLLACLPCLHVFLPVETSVCTSTPSATISVLLSRLCPLGPAGLGPAESRCGEGAPYAWRASLSSAHADPVRYKLGGGEASPPHGSDGHGNGHGNGIGMGGSGAVAVGGTTAGVRYLVIM